MRHATVGVVDTFTLLTTPTNSTPKPPPRSVEAARAASCERRRARAPCRPRCSSRRIGDSAARSLCSARSKHSPTKRRCTHEGVAFQVRRDARHRDELAARFKCDSCAGCSRSPSPASMPFSNGRCRGARSSMSRSEARSAPRDDDLRD